MTSKQRAYLRSMANTLEPIFQIGKSGISDNLVQQLIDALAARELIKIHVLETAPDTAKELGIKLSNLTENQVIAAVITLVFSIIPLFVSYGTGIFSNLALINLFQKFPANVISLKEVVGLLSFTVMCITLTILVIQRRKCLK